MANRVEHLAEGVTLYLGSSADIIHTLPLPDAFLADPPYGVSGQQNTQTAKNRGGRKNDYASFDDSPEYVREHAVPVIETLVRAGIRGLVTPGNRCFGFYPPASSFGAIYQPASVGLQPWGRADAQPILYYGKSPFGGSQLPGQKCSYTLTEAAEPNGHPCPKPIRFWTAIVQSISTPGELVFDPFMGSGTTGVACVKLGRRFIGVEVDPGYFEIAIKRISAALREPDMFVAPPKPAEQLSILDGAA